jgi:aminoglycoside phosphotransferase
VRHNHQQDGDPAQSIKRLISGLHQLHQLNITLCHKLRKLISVSLART